MIDIIKAVVLGIIEGITEWLPISSTGHLILADEVLKLGVSPEFKEMFDVVIQLGAIMAVVVIYWQKLWPFTTKQNGYIKKKSMLLWSKVLVACIPAGVVGLLFDDWIDEHLFNPTTVVVTLIVYGILFIVIERINKGKEPTITSFKGMPYKTAFFIGAFQALALIPGTSRSGATILGAMLLGTSRVIAAEFSFYLAVPAMFGASFLKIIKYLTHSGLEINGLEVVLLAVGMIIAFVVSIVAIKFFIGYIKKKSFTAFGWYRIGLGLLVLLYFYVIAK